MGLPSAFVQSDVIATAQSWMERYHKVSESLVSLEDADLISLYVSGRDIPLHIEELFKVERELQVLDLRYTTQIFSIILDHSI